jgi:murein DD-endopeptidase MepM/ murein hydrolase activator NlpD
VADLGVPVPSLTPLPTVTVPPLPLPTSTSVPLPTSSGGVSLPEPTLTGGGSGDGGAGGAGSAGSTGIGGSSGLAASSGGGGASASGGSSPAPDRTSRRKAAARAAKNATPMVAGTDHADEVVDQESSPQLYAAGQQFLRADQAIAEIDRQKRVLARLEQDAADTAQLYRAMGYDVDGARRVANVWHRRLDKLGADTAAAERRLVEDSATRADERVGDLVVARERVRADFETIAARYEDTKQELADANTRLEQLAAQRSTALQAVRAARGSDVALTQARVAESGRLGAQIEALSERLQRRGDTVQGTGRFAHPLDGVITSPYGMRFHPILHYTKLHTGTDFAGGSVIHAADDGRVLMTVVSTAYGNFTVIDHGVIDGRHVTTAYAHQARFLVHPGQVVRKGDPIGIVGQTGYATGPHLHFEVRENGTVVDPMRFLARH